MGSKNNDGYNLFNTLLGGLNHFGLHWRRVSKAICSCWTHQRQSYQYKLYDFTAAWWRWKAYNLVVPTDVRFLNKAAQSEKLISFSCFNTFIYHSLLGPTKCVKNLVYNRKLLHISIWLNSFRGYKENV